MSIAEQLYYNQVQMLPVAEQLRLVTLVTQSLSKSSLIDSLEATSTAETHQTGNQHSIMELHGLGAESWRGIDAQAYIDALRDEWEQSPKL